MAFYGGGGGYNQPPSGYQPQGGYRPPAGAPPAGYPAPGAPAPAQGKYGPAPGAYGSVPGYPQQAAPGGYGVPPPAAGGYGAPAPGGYPPAQGGQYGVPAGGMPPGGPGVLGPVPGAMGGAPPGYGQPPMGYGQAPPMGYGSPFAAPNAQFQQCWYAQYQQQMTPAEVQSAQQWFISVDKDRSGNISADELAWLNFGGRQLGVDAGKKLVKVFDRDRSNSIDFHEYCALHKFLSVCQEAFFGADRDRSGTLTESEIMGALNTARFPIAPGALHKFFLKQYSLAPIPGRAPGLDFQQFIAMMAEIAAVRSKFEWADPQRTGRVSLDIQGMYDFVADS